jgi:hypothetical protein
MIRSMRTAAVTVALLAVLPAVAQTENPASVPATPPALVSAPEGSLTPVVGRYVRDAEGTDVGRVWDVLVDDHGIPRAAVIDYGGVLGIGRRKVAVDWSALKFGMTHSSDDVTMALTKEQMGAIPDFQYSPGDATVGAVRSAR